MVHVGYGLTVFILVLVVAALTAVIFKSRKKKHEGLFVLENLLISIMLDTGIHRGLSETFLFLFKEFGIKMTTFICSIEHQKLEML